MKHGQNITQKWESERHNVSHTTFFSPLLWESTSYWRYRHRVWLWLMETWSAGHAINSSWNMSVNPTLAFMSIWDAHPPSKLLYQLVLVACELSPCKLSPTYFHPGSASGLLQPLDLAVNYGITSYKKGIMPRRNKLCSANCSKWH